MEVESLIKLKEVELKKDQVEKTFKILDEEFLS